MRLSRRAGISVMVFSATYLVLPVPELPDVVTPATAAPPRKSANLKETLESGLRARRPEEFAFLQRVITMVDEGRLPVDLVRSTFDWARDKRPYPYPYFERGLKIRAARLGITVQ